MAIPSSVCIPTISVYYRSDRLSLKNFAMLPQSRSPFPVFRLHHPVGPQPSWIISINTKYAGIHNALSMRFQCRCTKEENLAKTKTAVTKDNTAPVRWFASLFFIAATLFLTSKKKEPENVYLADLVAIDDAKAEFEYLISILQGSSRHTSMGLTLPDGILLHGPSGTGKTALVNAVAQKSQVAFFPVDASNIAKVSKDAVGIQSLFTEARISSPSIIVIDNVDVIARKGEISASDPTIKELHKEMKKCKRERSMVLVIATTNTPEPLDPAFMEGDMFFTKVLLDKPDLAGRAKIVGSYLKMALWEEEREAICDFVASQTPGSTGTRLRSITEDY